MEKVNDSTPVPVYDSPQYYQAPTPIQPIQPDAAYVHDPVHGQKQGQTTFYGGIQQQQQQPPVNTYHTATPLHALQRGPTPVDCPVCAHREMTRVEAEAGSTTHGWAALLCCCFCLGCIPYMLTSLKDMNHYCGKCGAHLATWHNSGRVEVHQNGSLPPAPLG